MLKITKTIPTEVTLDMPKITESFDGVPEDDDCLLNDDFGCSDADCGNCIFQYDNYKALRSQSEPEDGATELPDDDWVTATELRECNEEGTPLFGNKADQIITDFTRPLLKALLTEPPECQHFDPDNLYCTQCGSPTSCPEFTKTGDCPY